MGNVFADPEDNLKRARLTFALGFLLVVAISGCAASNPTAKPTTNETAPAEAASPVVQTPAPAVTPRTIPGAASFEMTETDASGYLFTVAVKMQPLSVTVDTVNAPPGQALVTFGGSGVATITSNSVGKVAPTYNVIVRSSVAAFWPGQTGICATAVPSGTVYSMYAVKGGYRVNGPSGCTLNFGFHATDGAGTLTEGASETVPLVLSGSQFQVTEVDARSISAAIAAQSQIWLGSGSTPVFDGECTQGAVGDISVRWASRPVDGCNIPQIGP